MPASSSGDKEVKYTKAAEFRSSAISGQPVSALFVGSPGHILYDESVKKKFHVAFMSKLARRSWFCYAPNKIDEPVFHIYQDIDNKRFVFSIRGSCSLSDWITDLDAVPKPITWDC